MFFSNCTQRTDVPEQDIQETAQQVGDVVAAIDEVGGNSGNINTAALPDSMWKAMARLSPQDVLSDKSWGALVLPEAQAASCLSSFFGSCTGTSTLVRSYQSCTLGATVVSGDVTYAWSNTASNCSLKNNSETLTRSPNLTIYGRRNAVLSITKTGVEGQKITRNTLNSFSLTSDGIRRRFQTTQGQVLYDQTTATVTPLTFTGANRSGRVLSSGTLRVTNNLNNTVCEFTPSNVTWAGSCNCPTSGSFSGTCTGAVTSTLTFTGCGTATYQEASQTESVTLDRCGN